MDPGYARLPDGLDPADMLTQRGPAALTAAVASGLPALHPLGDQLLTARLVNLEAQHALLAARRVLSARPSRVWEPGINQVQTGLPLLTGGYAATCETRSGHGTPTRGGRALAEIHQSSEVRARLSAAADKTSADRWAPLARELDPRLLNQDDWPATAVMLQRAHEHGRDVATSTRAIVDEPPLGNSPARELRYRIVSLLGVPIDEMSPLDSPAIRQSPGVHNPWSSPSMDPWTSPTGRR